jgi:hypothetical protein
MADREGSPRNCSGLLMKSASWLFEESRTESSLLSHTEGGEDLVQHIVGCDQADNVF